MSIEAMKQALEALDYASYKTEPEGDLNCNCLICQATVAVREAITEAEKQDGYCQACDGDSCTAKQGCVALDNPPQREWVGLTDEEIQKKRHLIDWTAGWSYNTFARAIEAKLKEKNT